MRSKQGAVHHKLKQSNLVPERAHHTRTIQEYWTRFRSSGRFRGAKVMDGSGMLWSVLGRLGGGGFGHGGGPDAHRSIVRGTSEHE